MKAEQTKDELYERAQDLDIEGRSEMSKEELAIAIADAEDGSSNAGGGERDPLRHTPGSTSPKTGPVPPPGPVAGSGNVESDSRFGIAANRSASRVVTSRERREARRARRAGE